MGCGNHQGEERNFYGESLHDISLPINGQEQYSLSVKAKPDAQTSDLSPLITHQLIVLSLPNVYT